MFAWIHKVGKLGKYSGTTLYNIILLFTIIIGIVIIPLVSGIVNFIITIVTGILIILWIVINTIIVVSLWTYRKTTSVGSETLELLTAGAEYASSTTTAGVQYLTPKIKNAKKYGLKKGKEYGVATMDTTYDLTRWTLGFLWHQIKLPYYYWRLGRDVTLGKIEWDMAKTNVGNGNQN